MEIQELRDKASVLKREKQSFLNDTFFWVKLAREAVEALPDTKFEFEVPKAETERDVRFYVLPMNTIILVMVA